MPASRATTTASAVGSPAKTRMNAADIAQAPRAKTRSPGLRPVRDVQRERICCTAMLPIAQVAQNWLMNAAGWAWSSASE